MKNWILRNIWKTNLLLLTHFSPVPHFYTPWKRHKTKGWDVGIGMLKKLNNHLQYNAALAITGAIWESSKDKLYQKLGFKYLSLRRWLRKLCLFYKIVVNKSPNYLYNYVSTINESYLTKSGDKFLHMSCITEYFAFRTYPRNGII